MYNVLTLNKISETGIKNFTSDYKCSDEIKNPDAILVRSASMHETEFAPETLAVARAGAGVNNIPIDECAKKGIVVFNTPGANANAVKELVLCGLLLSSRKIVPAIEWVKTTLKGDENFSKSVEKGKSAFAGPEIKGKKLGVIGLGNDRVDNGLKLLTEENRNYSRRCFLRAQAVVIARKGNGAAQKLLSKQLDVDVDLTDYLMEIGRASCRERV